MTDRRYPLARPLAWDLESFARQTQLHPDVVLRLVELGLIEPISPASAEPRFTDVQIVAVARIRRLRASFSLNYAAIGLVVDLLDRIAELETLHRPAGPHTDATPGATGPDTPSDTDDNRPDGTPHGGR